MSDYAHSADDASWSSSLSSVNYVSVWTPGKRRWWHRLLRRQPRDRMLGTLGTAGATPEIGEGVRLTLCADGTFVIDFDSKPPEEGEQ